MIFIGCAQARALHCCWPLVASAPAGSHSLSLTWTQTVLVINSDLPWYIHDNSKWQFCVRVRVHRIRGSVPCCCDYQCCSGPGWYIFFPHSFSLFPNKITFSPDPPFFSPNSVTAMTKTLTYPGTLGRHTLNAAVWFMMYPKLWNFMWKKREGTWEKRALCGEKEKTLGGKYIFLGPGGWVRLN